MSAGRFGRLIFSWATPLTLLVALVGCDGPTETQVPQDLGPGPDMSVPPTRFGFVRAGASSFTAGTQTSTESMASALFIDTAATASGCSRTVAGECTMYRCSGTGFRYPGAGDIQVKPATGTGFTLSATADGYYVEQINTSALLFAANQGVTLGAAGKDVPAFSADLTVPSSSFTINSPNAGRNNLGWIIPKSADFQIDWSSNAARIAIELTQGTSEAFGGVTIRCNFAGAAGSGKVPASLLANLKPTVGSTNPARILLGPVASKQVQNMGWLIDTMVVGVGRSGDVTIQ
ncbi:MAG: hypothetical protein U1A78_03995 [Polyangia bacterium]